MAKKKRQPPDSNRLSKNKNASQETPSKFRIISKCAFQNIQKVFVALIRLKDIIEVFETVLKTFF